MVEPQVGDIVSIEFEDHAESTSEEGAHTVNCTVFGAVHSKDENQIIIASWITEKGPNDSHYFAIVRSAMHEIIVLKPT